MLAEAVLPVYTFEVASSASKATVAKEVARIYKMKPTSVRITKLPAKRIVTRQGVGRKPGVKKALVTFKVGDKIEAM